MNSVTRIQRVARTIHLTYRRTCSFSKPNKLMISYLYFLPTVPQSVKIFQIPKPRICTLKFASRKQRSHCHCQYLMKKNKYFLRLLSLWTFKFPMYEVTHSKWKIRIYWQKTIPPPSPFHLVIRYPHPIRRPPSPQTRSVLLGEGGGGVWLETSMLYWHMFPYTVQCNAPPPHDP